LLAAEARSHGTTADDAVLVQVALREAAAAGADVPDDPRAELTGVELLRAVLCEPLERVREVALHERVADAERAAVVLVDRGRLRGVVEDQVEDAVQVRLSLVELHAVARELDRRLEELAPRQAPERAVRGLEPERRARDRTRRRADVEPLRRAAAEVDVDVIHAAERAPVAEPGDGDEVVEDARALVTRAVHEHEGAGARAGEGAFCNPRDGGRADGCVDGVAAGLQHLCTRPRGEHMSARHRPLHAGRLEARASSGGTTAARARRP